MKVVRHCLSAACFAGIFCIALAAQTSSRRPSRAQVPPAQSRLVDVEGRKITFKVAGSGSPTVVLEYGLGGSSGNWDSILPEVARFTRVVSYDRAG